MTMDKIVTTFINLLSINSYYEYLVLMIDCMYN